VGLIQDIENRLLELLKSFFKPVISPLQKLWGLIKNFFTALIDVIPETIDLVKLIISEVDAWRHFKNNLSFRSGVINLQSVRDRISDLIQDFVNAWHALQGLFTDGFKMPVKTVNEAAEALEDVITAFEDFFGKVGLKEALSKLGTTLEKAGGKVFEVLAIIQACAEAALRVVRQLRAIVDATKDVRETFQEGKGLFLQQQNKRKIVKLDDGSVMKIRLGNLH